MSDGPLNPYMRSPVYFPITDPEVMGFLGRLGVDPQFLDDGELTDQECQVAGINGAVLAAVSKLAEDVADPGTSPALRELHDTYVDVDPRLVPNAPWLDAADLRVAAPLENLGAGGVQGLFSARECPGRSGGLGLRVFDHYLRQAGIDPFKHVWPPFGRGDIFIPETVCPFRTDYPHDSQVWTHFVDATVPAAVVDYGASVYVVREGASTGSAVAVAHGGRRLLVSAYHVVGSEESEKVGPVVVLPTGEALSLYGVPRILDDPGRDLVVFDFTTEPRWNPLRELPPARHHGPLSSAVWMIGHPMNFIERAGSSSRQPTRNYTPGTVLDSGDPRFVMIRGNVTGGYSGGAILSTAGELLGIISTDYSRIMSDRSGQLFQASLGTAGPWVTPADLVPQVGPPRALRDRP